VTPLSSDFEDMFRDHKPVLSSGTSRDIPIITRDSHGQDGGRLLNIMNDDGFDIGKVTF